MWSVGISLLVFDSKVAGRFVIFHEYHVARSWVRLPSVVRNTARVRHLGRQVSFQHRYIRAFVPNIHAFVVVGDELYWNRYMHLVGVTRHFCLATLFQKRKPFLPTKTIHEL